MLDEGKGGAADFPRAARSLLAAARSGHNETIEALQGDMKTWSSSTRTEGSSLSLLASAQPADPAPTMT